MSHRVKVSSKHQTAGPSSIRTELGLGSGDHQLADGRNGVNALVPAGRSAVEQLRGHHREIWEGVDAQDYVNQERDGW